MTVNQARIFADLSEMLRAISESLPPGEEITLETKLIEDLELQSLGIANLTGRVQSRYGTQASLVPFFAGREAGPFRDLRVGELVEYLVKVLDEAPAHEAPDNGARRPLPRPDSFIAARNGHRQQNDNVGVLSELAPGARRQLIELPEGPVEVFIAGEGPALVLMHPINVGAGVFARQFAGLAADYTVVCMHHPGVGATAWDGDVTLPGLARLHRTALAELSIAPPFHVLGSSFGGVVAQQFALLYPRECATLTLVGCSYQVGARRRGVRVLPVVVDQEFGRERAGGNGARLDVARVEGAGDLGDVLLRCESMDTRIGVKYLGLFEEHPSLLAQLPEIAPPTLVVHGDRDTLVPAKRAHVLYGAIPRAELAEITQAGHFPTLTHPEEVHEVLLPFLAAGRGASRPRRRRSGVSLTTSGFVPPVPPQECTVIIGSGRCGSTMLSRLIAEEDETLSVSESLGHRMRAFLVRDPGTELTGAEYWAIMSGPGREPGAEGRLMHRLGFVPAQFSYPASGRYAATPGSIPPIMVITLPQLTDDPDGLFDRLGEIVPGFPPQTALSHHKMLLDLLADITGKRRWVERTGASSEIADPLLRTFSEAKVVYLTRNIAATALSMSKHPAFLMTAVRNDFHTRYGVDPFAPKALAAGMTLPDEAGIPEELRRLLPHRITLEALREVGRDIRPFERMAAHMNGCAEQALGDVRPKKLYRVRYEDIVERPADELTRLGEFIGFAEPDRWAARAAGMVKRTSARSGGVSALPVL